MAMKRESQAEQDLADWAVIFRYIHEQGAREEAARG
jgi:hypothetical protein